MGADRIRTQPSGRGFLSAFVSAASSASMEEGGGTNFPRLDLTVQPKKGSAVLWPSVLDEDPTRQDARTHHQAKPVIKGLKYAANYWIHGDDFKTPLSPAQERPALCQHAGGSPRGYLHGCLLCRRRSTYYGCTY